MGILVLSDIHANFLALQSVLDSAGTVDDVWCLGDTVGYGPQPNECVAEMRQRAGQLLVGNHDLGCLGTISLAQFNREARIANEWNGRQLTPKNRAFLLDLKPMHQVNETVTLAHASPYDPVWEYVIDTEIALRAFDHFETQVCFVGHSHVPAIYELRDGECHVQMTYAEKVLRLKPDSRYIINPGGVGQPRDSDSRAAWILYDEKRQVITFKRTPYNIRRTQQLMRNAGLPEVLAMRLSFGV